MVWIIDSSLVASFSLLWALGVAWVGPNHFRWPLDHEKAFCYLCLGLAESLNADWIEARLDISFYLRIDARLFKQKALVNRMI